MRSSRNAPGKRNNHSSPVILGTSEARTPESMNQKMYVYIMANNRSTLYTGVTNNLVRRVYEHKQELVEGFTKKYHLHKLVYYEDIDGQLQAIIREKQIKDMNRTNKLQMIQRFNPQLEDLYSKITEDSGQARMTGGGVHVRH